MITAIKNTNSELYKDLFAKASEVLSGYERTQTFDENQTYFYKNDGTNSFSELIFASTDKEDKIYEFADALTTHTHLYVSNGKNPSDYNFAPELGITTLEEYYNWLPEIKKDKDGKPTVFTKLPLDEAHFEIKANTRAITIPDEFKKNGIAVQGDDLAEVVYFMIDRYFDAMDLNNTDIYIEWETPKTKTTNAIKSISEPYLKIIDDENYPGKLIFGWAISDAITKESGTLKFAIRFVKWDDNKKLVYSFNTLTAQVTIHPNLGLDLENDEYEIDNCNDRLLERIEPSVVVGGAQAAVPYFLINIETLEDGYDIKDNHTTGTYDLSVVATADDTGAVSYVWKRSEIGEDAWTEIPNSSETVMVALTPEELAEFNFILPSSHSYYLSNGDNLLPKGLYNLNDAATKAEFKKMFKDLEEGELPTIYEKRSILTVEKWGQYKAEARNRIFNSLTKANSKIATFKTPDEVVMNNENQTSDKHILNTDSATLAPVIVEAVGDLTYQWFRADENEGEFKSVSDVGATDSVFTASEPGWYKLEVTRIRNRAETSGESIKYRVTNAPAVPVFIENIEDNRNIFIEDLLSDAKRLSVEWEDDIQFDEFIVAWYLYRGNKGVSDLNIATFNISDAFISEFNPADTVYDPIFDEANENREGLYYAIVKNKLNGVESDFNQKPAINKMFVVTGS